MTGRFGVVGFVRAVLWCVLGAAILTVIVMTWHPWVAPWTGIKH